MIKENGGNPIFNAGAENKEGLTGRNNTAHDFYMRHAEKASGQVFGADGRISQSKISPQGRIQSWLLGRDIPPPVPGTLLKMNWSEIERTQETNEQMLEGQLENLGGYVSRYRDRTKGNFQGGETCPAEFGELYISKWEMNKSKLLNKLYGENIKLEDLSASEQAHIAENAEAPVVREWLDDSNSELARLYPADEAAAQFALLVRRNINMVDRVKSGSNLERFNGIHRAASEPLFMKIIILPNGRKPEKLEDIGGPLGLNEGWEVITKTDEKAEKRVEIVMYRVISGDNPHYQKVSFEVDMSELNRLADMGVEIKNKVISDRIDAEKVDKAY